MNPLASGNPARISEDELELLLSPDKDLLCAITGELFEDPVVTEDGHTYERGAIEEWFHSQKLAGRPVTSPLTNVKLKNTRLVQNNAVKSAVIKWCEDLAKRAKELADQYPDSAVDLLERALEYHPDNADTWMQLALAHQGQGAEGWCAAAFRCRFNHAQAKDTAEDYTGFLEWCETHDCLAEFEATVLRIAEAKCPDLGDALADALERTGGETLNFEDAPRRAQMNSTDHDASFKKAYQPRDEMPDQRIYSCKIKKIPPSIEYQTKREQPALLCVSSEGVTVIDAIAKLQSPIVCRYTFHQILSWTVTNDTFSFHVLLRVNGANQKEAFEFFTPEGKTISMRLKEHVNVLLLERSRERRSRVRPRATSGPGAAAAAAAEQTSLGGLVLDEFYGVPDSERGRDDPTAATAAAAGPVPVRAGMMSQSQSVAGMAGTLGGESGQMQGDENPPSDAMWSTASIPPPSVSMLPPLTPSMSPGAGAGGGGASPLSSSPRVDPAQVRELSLVFPNEPAAELERVLLASDGSFEAAAAVLLEKPLEQTRSSFRQTSSWSPDLSGVVRSSGSSSADVIEGAMAIMSAAMDASGLQTTNAAPELHRVPSLSLAEQPHGHGAAHVQSRAVAAAAASRAAGGGTVGGQTQTAARRAGARAGHRGSGSGNSLGPCPLELAPHPQQQQQSAQAEAEAAFAESTETMTGLASEPSSPAGSAASLMEQLVGLPVPTCTGGVHARAGGKSSASTSRGGRVNSAGTVMTMTPVRTDSRTRRTHAPMPAE